jgi:hypothetical protein
VNDKQGSNERNVGCDKRQGGWNGIFICGYRNKQLLYATNLNAGTTGLSNRKYPKDRDGKEMRDLDDMKNIMK